MRRPGWSKLEAPPNGDVRRALGSLRDRVAVVVAAVTFVGLCAMFVASKGTRVLMPGPLTRAHGAIEACGTCHTKSGEGKLTWIHGLVAGDPLADSKACLTCHKMPDTAFNAHGASADVLRQSTERLVKIAAQSPAPQSARAQSIAFPTRDMVSSGLECATCHQEHQGANFKLNKISNEQCRSCHVVQFDSFDGHHPKFDSYPFKRRSRIVYDHAGHFGKHFPEVAKKDPARRIPETCSSCHNSGGDKRIMAVAPFDQTCAACHLDQIVGKERASGPKGIAFLTLPGLDLQTLKKKNAAMGEWPEASDATLTPFMKVMIGRTVQGRTLIKTVDGLNLQDLANANDDQIKAVTDLVWEIKGLYFALISGKASDVLGNFNITGAKLSANLATDLTASIPRDVLISAQQQWLPNLASEMARRSGGGEAEQSVWGTMTTEPAAGVASPDASTASEAGVAARSERPAGGGEQGDDPAAKEGGHEAPSKALPDQQACLVSILGQCVLSKEPKGEGEGAKQSGSSGTTGNANSKAGGGKAKSSAEDLPAAMQAGLKEIAQAEQAEGAAGKPDAGKTLGGGKDAPAVADHAKGKAGDSADELLFPNEEEQREINARTKGGAARSDIAKGGGGGGAPADGGAARFQTAPAISIDSGVDPESWAEYGGWYRQDYGIFYRPTGHKDKFIYSWLFLTGPQGPKGDMSPAAAVFDFLTSKDAQGSCTKCHSVDDIPGKGRVVNFSPPSVATKQGQFTNFIHEPHFGILENRGCLTCHTLEKDRPYLKSYEQGNPQNFVSNFGAVKKDLCQTCHNSGMARQDCLTCHKYHVNGVVSPIMSTKVPTQ